MVWKLGELQSVYNELQFYVKTTSPGKTLLKFCSLFVLHHYTKKSSQHKQKKIRTKALCMFPDHTVPLFTINLIKSSLNYVLIALSRSVAQPLILRFLFAARKRFIMLI